MNSFSSWASNIVLMLCCHNAFASIEVFTASHLPISNVPHSAVVAELDTLSGLDDTLSAGLPADPAVAQREAQQRLASNQFHQLRNQYEYAATAVSRAWQLGIEKLPAVVVDGQYVVYGQSDIAAAIRVIEEATQ